MSFHVKRDEPLAKYTSWLIGGVADEYVEPTSLEELKTAVEYSHSMKLAITILGGGSNVLISDKGIRGLVINLRKFSGTQVHESDRLNIEALAGTGKSELLKIFLKYKLAPALFLAGLPGDVGGGVVMNAGVAEGFSPREFVEIIDWVEVLRLNDLSVHRLQKSELHWKYRHCEGWQPGIIVKAGISWPNQPDETILAKVRDANKTRLSKQPLDMPSCGSVFKNPDGHKAAQLIDSSGLKGKTIGAAQVSLKHANFIVNLGGATAVDTWSLIQTVKAEVARVKGVELVTEVVRLGDWN
jgi:UDP-N-acetylmuramate dehydrogenase